VWTELRFTVDGELAEAWSDALIEAGAASVQCEDADADSPAEVALFGEPGEPAPAASWRRTRLAALIDRDQAIEALLLRASAQGGLVPPTDYECEPVAEQDWVRLTQSQFDPIEIGERLLIAPSWHRDALLAQDGLAKRRLIELDPGLAFGTGSHPTTRMCLEWLERQALTGRSVIDYGCGSGILGIAAGLLGAASVLAVDIDPQAVIAARDNARRNGVDLDCRSASESIGGPFDVVLANILANPLRVLAPVLAALVRPGGQLVLAGLLASQSAEIMACYPQFDLRVDAEREGWACLAGPRVR
jgi:ribosomal protein L11 methyltransferase